MSNKLNSFTNNPNISTATNITNTSKLKYMLECINHPYENAHYYCFECSISFCNLCLNKHFKGKDSNINTNDKDNVLNHKIIDKYDYNIPTDTLVSNIIEEIVDQLKSLEETFKKLSYIEEDENKNSLSTNNTNNNGDISKRINNCHNLVTSINSYLSSFYSIEIKHTYLNLKNKLKAFSNNLSSFRSTCISVLKQHLSTNDYEFDIMLVEDQQFLEIHNTITELYKGKESLKKYLEKLSNDLDIVVKLKSDFEECFYKEISEGFSKVKEKFPFKNSNISNININNNCNNIIQSPSNDNNNKIPNDNNGSSSSRVDKFKGNNILPLSPPDQSSSAISFFKNRNNKNINSNNNYYYNSTNNSFNYNNNNNSSTSNLNFNNISCSKIFHVDKNSVIDELIEEDFEFTKQNKIANRDITNHGNDKTSNAYKQIKNIEKENISNNINNPKSRVTRVISQYCNTKESSSNTKDNNKVVKKLSNNNINNTNNINHANSSLNISSYHSFYSNNNSEKHSKNNFNSVSKIKSLRNGCNTNNTSTNNNANASNLVKSNRNYSYTNNTSTSRLINMYNNSKHKKLDNNGNSNQINHTNLNSNSNINYYNNNIRDNKMIKKSGKGNISIKNSVLFSNKSFNNNNIQNNDNNTNNTDNKYNIDYTSRSSSKKSSKIRIKISNSISESKCDTSINNNNKKEISENKSIINNVENKKKIIYDNKDNEDKDYKENSNSINDDSDDENESTIIKKCTNDVYFNININSDSSNKKDEMRKQKSHHKTNTDNIIKQVNNNDDTKKNKSNNNTNISVFTDTMTCMTLPNQTFTSNLNLDRKQTHQLLNYPENKKGIFSTNENTITNDINTKTNINTDTKTNTHSTLLLKRKLDKHSEFVIYNTSLRKFEILTPEINSVFKIKRFYEFSIYINVNNTIYISGGKKKSKKMSKCFLSYNYNTNELIQLSDMLNKRCSHSMIYSYSSNEIFSIGGYANKSCEKYDISLNKWFKLDSLHKERQVPTLFFCNFSSKSYLYCGFGFITDETLDDIEDFERLEVSRNSGFSSFGNNNKLMSSCYTNFTNTSGNCFSSLKNKWEVISISVSGISDCIRIFNTGIIGMQCKICRSDGIKSKSIDDNIKCSCSNCFLILGGENYKGDETDDIYLLNINNSVIKPYKEGKLKLPSKTSFIEKNFINYDDNLFAQFEMKRSNILVVDLNNDDIYLEKLGLNNIANNYIL